jgi:hypothetical protein
MTILEPWGVLSVATNLLVFMRALSSSRQRFHNEAFKLNFINSRFDFSRTQHASFIHHLSHHQAKTDKAMNGSEHGSTTSARSSNSCGEASLVTSSLTSDDGSGTTSPTGSSDSSSIASAQFPWNVAAMLHQLQQGSHHNNFAQTTTLLQKALAEEIQRAQLLQSQLAALDKAALAQASAAQQQAALLSSSGISVPPALQQAAVVNALLLNRSFAAQARSGLTPMSLGALAGTAAALQPPNLTSLLQQHQLKPIMPLSSNINPQPGNFSTNTLAQTQHAVTEVEYRDASLLPDPVDTATKGRAEPFPVKLHRMLSELEQEGKDDVCSFLPHGRAFAVHKPKQFANEIMPKYFRMSRFSSFQRQLNLCKCCAVFCGVVYTFLMY